MEHLPDWVTSVLLPALVVLGAFVSTRARLQGRRQRMEAARKSGRSSGSGTAGGAGRGSGDDDTGDGGVDGADGDTGDGASSSP